LAAYGPVQEAFLLFDHQVKICSTWAGLLTEKPQFDLSAEESLRFYQRAGPLKSYYRQSGRQYHVGVSNMTIHHVHVRHHVAVPHRLVPLVPRFADLFAFVGGATDLVQGRVLAFRSSVTFSRQFRNTTWCCQANTGCDAGPFLVGQRRRIA